jgi:hypothetical protein
MSGSNTSHEYEYVNGDRAVTTGWHPALRLCGNSACMQEFYVEIEATRHVDFAALTRILVDYAQSQGQPQHCCASV